MLLMNFLNVSEASGKDCSFEIRFLVKREGTDGNVCIFRGIFVGSWGARGHLQIPRIDQWYGVLDLELYGMDLRQKLLSIFF